MDVKRLALNWCWFGFSLLSFPRSHPLSSQRDEETLSLSFSLLHLALLSFSPPFQGRRERKKRGCKRIKSLTAECWKKEEKEKNKTSAKKRNAANCQERSNVALLYLLPSIRTFSMTATFFFASKHRVPEWLKKKSSTIVRCLPRLEKLLFFKGSGGSGRKKRAETKKVPR